MHPCQKALQLLNKSLRRRRLSTLDLLAPRQNQAKNSATFDDTLIKLWAITGMRRLPVR